MQSRFSVGVHKIRGIATQSKAALVPSDPPLQRIVLSGQREVFFTDAGRKDTNKNEFGSTPTIVALHGAPGSNRDFRWLGACLEPHLRFVRLDLPGHGQTPSSSCLEPSPAGYAQFLDEFLSETNIHEPIIVLGHSIGGPIAMEYALKFPDKVKGLALLASVGTIRHKALGPTSTRKFVQFVSSQGPWMKYLIMNLLRMVNMCISC